MQIRDIKRALTAKLDAREVEGKKHDRYAVYDPDKPDRKLYSIDFSRGAASIDGESLLRHIAVEELRLRSLRDLKDLVNCPLDGATALKLIHTSVSDLR